jgi:hypothetical protein
MQLCSDDVHPTAVSTRRCDVNLAVASKEAGEAQWRGDDINTETRLCGDGVRQLRRP